MLDKASRSVWLAMSVLMVAVLVAGCGQSSPSSGTAPQAPAAQPTTAPAAKAAAPTQAPAAAAQPTQAPTSAPTRAAAAATTATGGQPTSAAAGAGAAATAPAGGAATGKPLKIGLLSDTSGALAIYGPTLENGFKLGLEYATQGSNAVAGRPIQVIIKDTASKPDTAVSQARELIEKDGVDLLAGGVSSAVALAVAEVAKSNKKIYVAEPANSPDITGKNFNEYVFRTSRTAFQDALTLGPAVPNLGKKYLIIAQDYAFGYGQAAAFYNVIKANGGSFVVNDNKDKNGAIFIPVDTTDFTPYLQQVLTAAPDVVIISWAGAGAVPLFQQLDQLGIAKMAKIVGTGFGDNKTVSASPKENIGIIAPHVYHYTLPKNPINDWLVKRHQEDFKTPPDLFTEGGFALAQMIVEGVKKTNGDTSAEKLIPAFEGLEFDSPKGMYKIRKSDHVALQPMFLAKLISLTAPDYKYFELVQTMKPEETAPPCALEGDNKSRCQ